MEKLLVSFRCNHKLQTLASKLPTKVFILNVQSHEALSMKKIKTLYTKAKEGSENMLLLSSIQMVLL